MVKGHRSHISTTRRFYGSKNIRDHFEVKTDKWIRRLNLEIKRKKKNLCWSKEDMEWKRK